MMMFKAGLVAFVTALLTADAFVAPITPRARSVKVMSGKAQLDILPRVILTDAVTGHEATVHLHGGCVTSYKAPHEVGKETYVTEFIRRQFNNKTTPSTP